MERILKQIFCRLTALLSLMVPAVSFMLCGCEPAFPNDKLDNFWKLERIEYPGGTDFRGNAVQCEDVNGVYLGMARNIVQVENHARNFDVYGILSDMTDSIKFDFSNSIINGIHDTDAIKANLLYCGMDSVVMVFNVDKLTSKSLVLSSGKSRLYLERW